MPVPFNLLRYGPLAPISDAIDSAQLTEAEVRAILQNLCDQVAKLQRDQEKRG